MISAVILTKNEENTIARCLASLSWVDEIIIIDDFSIDKTVEKVKSNKLEVKLFYRHINGDFAGQRNFGLAKTNGEWVLFIDADEIVSDALNKELGEVIKSKEMNGYFLIRKDYFLGKWLKYGETGNIRLLRLARKGAGKWVGKVHEEWKIQGDTQELKNQLYHYPHASIKEFLAEINTYSSIRVQELYSQKRKVSLFEIIFYPKLKFLQNYIWRMGFLDGFPGLVMAIMMSFHSFLVRSKLWHLQNKNQL